MYELVLSDNVYGIKEYDNKVSINPIIIDEDLISLTSIKKDDYNLNVFDVKFKPAVKKAEKIDYLMSIFSGSFAYVIYHFIKGKSKKIDNLENIKFNDLFKISKDLLDYYNLSQAEIKAANIEIDKHIFTSSEKIKKVSKYKELTVDFAKGLNYNALVTSLICSIFEVEIGKDKKGKFTINNLDDDKLKGKTIFKKIQVGFIRWIISEAAQYKNTGKFEEETKEIFKVKGGIKKIKELVIELSETEFFKDKKFNLSYLIDYFINEVNEAKELDDEEILNYESSLKIEEIPIVFNKALVRAYYFVKTFIIQVKEHKTKTLEGLEVLDLAGSYKHGKRIITRMDTVSTSVFAALDVIPSFALALKKSYDTFKKDFDQDENRKDLFIKALKATEKGIGIFASSIDIANVFELVTVIKADKDYIVEDLKDLFNKTKLVEKKINTFSELKENQISTVLGLNTIETKILYSLELDIINTDIQDTKKSEEQIRKNNWKKEWIAKCEESLKFNKLFIKERDRLYSLIKNYKSTQNDFWLLKLLIELTTFRPYCQLDSDEKKYKHLKLEKNKYLENVFCKENEILEYKSVLNINNDYKKNKAKLDGSTVKTSAIIAGTSLLTIGTAGAAFAFAPAIAVGLVGGSFAGLSGAALTSASLALVGGGAVAAGGLGMAGGTIIIAGGGALLGLGTSGATATLLAFMSASNFVLEDNSKLLTKCDIMLNVYKMKNEVLNIQAQLLNEYNNSMVRLDVLKNTVELNNENKKDRSSLIKEQEKSLVIMKKTNEKLSEMIAKYDKK